MLEGWYMVIGPNLSRVFLQTQIWRRLMPASDSLKAPQTLEKIESGLVNGPPSEAPSAGPHGLTHLPLAFDDLTAASTNSRPLTPSSMVGKCADLSGFLPTRAALIARATSE